MLFYTSLKIDILKAGPKHRGVWIVVWENSHTSCEGKRTCKEGVGWKNREAFRVTELERVLVWGFSTEMTVSNNCLLACLPFSVRKVLAKFFLMNNKFCLVACDLHLCSHFGTYQFGNLALDLQFFVSFSFRFLFFSVCHCCHAWKLSICLLWCVKNNIWQPLVWIKFDY